jgi:hypothetical protein
LVGYYAERTGVDADSLLVLFEAAKTEQTESTEVRRTQRKGVERFSSSQPSDPEARPNGLPSSVTIVRAGSRETRALVEVPRWLPGSYVVSDADSLEHVQRRGRRLDTYFTRTVIATADGVDRYLFSEDFPDVDVEEIALAALEGAQVEDVGVREGYVVLRLRLDQTLRSGEATRLRFWRGVNLSGPGQSLSDATFWTPVERLTVRALFDERPQTVWWFGDTPAHAIRSQPERHQVKELDVFNYVDHVFSSVTAGPHYGLGWEWSP